uniref:Uncharacterized protein n=1 Tax=Romanomermis culicivorax TaxID=13658 RepID=A0A915JXN4_ROMCU
MIKKYRLAECTASLNDINSSLGPNYRKWVKRGFTGITLIASNQKLEKPDHISLQSYSFDGQSIHRSTKLIMAGIWIL